jgi:hypothetical protein
LILFFDQFDRSSSTNRTQQVDKLNGRLTSRSLRKQTPATAPNPIPASCAVAISRINPPITITRLFCVTILSDSRIWLNAERHRIAHTVDRDGLSRSTTSYGRMDVQDRGFRRLLCGVTSSTTPERKAWFNIAAGGRRFQVSLEALVTKNSSSHDDIAF